MRIVALGSTSRDCSCRLDRFTFKQVWDISLSFWNGGFVAEARKEEKRATFLSFYKLSEIFVEDIFYNISSLNREFIS